MACAHLICKRFPGHYVFKRLHAQAIALIFVQILGDGPVRLLADMSSLDYQASAACSDDTSVGGVMAIIGTILLTICAKVEPPSAAEPCGGSAGRWDNV